MTKYYIQHPWPAFKFGENEYDLSHLNEFVLETFDSANQSRQILVSFSDHCFTKTRESDDLDYLLYPNSSRGYQGIFCEIRYTYSKTLPENIKAVVNSKVWRVDGENFAIIPNLSGAGFYGIFFSLDKLKGLKMDLHLRVRSAYLMENPPVTYGNIRFSHLLTLRIQNKMPPRILAHHRKKPS